MRYLIENFRRHGSEINSHDILKFIAISLMVVDHVGFYFFPHEMSLRLIGRLSFPIFFFLIGYSLNYQIKKDLVIMALLLAVSDFFTGWEHYPLNILFSVIFCRLFLAWIEKKDYLERHLLDVIVVLVFFTLFSYVVFEYGTMAMLFALLGFFTRRKNSRPIYPYIVTGATYCFYQISGFLFNITQSIILVTAIAPLIYLFHEYRFHKFPNVPKFISYPVMFIGRNSLPFYFLHVLIFRCLWAIQW